MTRPDSAYLLVLAGGRRVGLALTSVVEVLEPGPAYPVPSLERSVRGITAVRGRILPVVDLGALLAGSPCPSGRGQVAVIVDLEGQRVCLEVDDAEAVLRGKTLPLPSGKALPWATGVARYAEELVPLLDLAALSARITEVASA
jgi:chemotaxis signal transduction protein